MDFVNWDDYIPTYIYIWKHKIHVPNHQPDIQKDSEIGQERLSTFTSRGIESSLFGKSSNGHNNVRTSKKNLEFNDRAIPAVNPTLIVGYYPLVNIQKAIEHDHRNSEFSH